MSSQPQILKRGLCQLHVCVPSRWVDHEIEGYANSMVPTGIASKWKVITNKNADGSLAKRYVKCEGREGWKHVVLEC
jgi:hypothetical protein